jgi:hypothetical protein
MRRALLIATGLMGVLMTTSAASANGGLVGNAGIFAVWSADWAGCALLNEGACTGAPPCNPEGGVNFATCQADTAVWAAICLLDASCTS